jgi:hypothetical protein
MWRNAAGRSVLRLLLGLAVGVAAAAGVVPARSQPGPAPQMPQVDQRVTIRSAEPPPPPASHGLSTAGQGVQQHAQASMAAANAVTQPCPGSSRDESRLGLMQHTAMYSHCDYP